MTEDLAGLSKAERKKARRNRRRISDRSSAQDLSDLADAAVDRAESLLGEVVDAPNEAASERAVDVEIETLATARYIAKRINNVLVTGEWIDEVEVWVWQADTHVRPPLTERGARCGVEVRLQQRTRAIG